MNLLVTKEELLKAVKLNAIALQDASETLKDDKEFMLAAIKQNYIFFIFASQRFPKR